MDIEYEMSDNLVFNLSMYLVTSLPSVGKPEVEGVELVSVYFVPSEYVTS